MPVPPWPEGTVRSGEFAPVKGVLRSMLLLTVAVCPPQAVLATAVYAPGTSVSGHGTG